MARVDMTWRCGRSLLWGAGAVLALLLFSVGSSTPAEAQGWQRVCYRVFGGYVCERRWVPRRSYRRRYRYEPRRPYHRPAYRANETVRKVQSALLALGYDIEKVDGRIGPNTRAAIREYQTDINEEPTGLLTQKQTERLYAAAESAPAAPRAGVPRTDRPDRGPVARRTAPLAPARRPGFVYSDASMATYCSDLVKRNVERQRIAPQAPPPGGIVPDQLCWNRAMLITSLREYQKGSPRAFQQRVKVCRQYSVEVEDLARRIGTADPAALTDYLTARYGGATRKARHRENADLCIRQAYAQNDPRQAVFFAMVMIGAGVESFTEIVGHHYALGFGVPKDLPRAEAWMQRALEAAEAGRPSIIEDTERASVLELMVAELKGKVQTGSHYDSAPKSPVAAKPDDAPADQPDADSGAVSRKAVELARAELASRRGEIVKTYDEFKSLLGADAAEVEKTCLEDKDKISAKILADPSTIDRKIDKLKKSVASGILRLNSSFCRAVSYREEHKPAMFYHDYVMYRLGRSDSAAFIAYHYILGNGVAADRKSAQDWLTQALKRADTARSKKVYADLLAVL